jgi:osmotically-inducible protein OsmY
MTTTARIKSKLVLNNNIRGRRINVDTRNGVVTLHGNVTDPQERDLAVQIARNTSYVTSVLNEIEVNEKAVTSAN